MNLLWADGEVESLSVGYDDARLVVREPTGRAVTVVGTGVLGVELLGLWDEMIVERGEVHTDDAFSRKCYQRVMDRLGPEISDSGSPARNTRRFSTLVVTFLDGSTLRVAAAAFSTMR